MSAKMDEEGRTSQDVGEEEEEDEVLLRLYSIQIDVIEKTLYCSEI